MIDAESFLSADPFSSVLGIKLVEASPGSARLRLEITDRHLNGNGAVHGGVIFSLADVAFAIASNSHGILSVGINATITYMKGASSGTLFAEATEFSRNHKLSTYNVEITDQDGNKIATFQGLAYRKRPKE